MNDNTGASASAKRCVRALRRFEGTPDEMAQVIDRECNIPQLLAVALAASKLGRSLSEIGITCPELSSLQAAVNNLAQFLNSGGGTIA